MVTPESRQVVSTYLYLQVAVPGCSQSVGQLRTEEWTKSVDHPSGKDSFSSNDFFSFFTFSFFISHLLRFIFHKNVSQATTFRGLHFTKKRRGCHDESLSRANHITFVDLEDW